MDLTRGRACQAESITATVLPVKVTAPPWSRGALYMFFRMWWSSARHIEAQKYFVTALAILSISQTTQLFRPTLPRQGMCLLPGKVREC